MDAQYIKKTQPGDNDKAVIRCRREHLDWSCWRIAKVLEMQPMTVDHILKKYCLSTVAEVIDGLPIIRLSLVEPERNAHLRY